MGQFVYNPDNHTLIWTNGGAPPGVGVQIATFSNDFIPQASDFIVV
jgi:hypothetical protein